MCRDESFCSIDNIVLNLSRLLVGKGEVRMRNRFIVLLLILMLSLVVALVPAAAQDAAVGTQDNPIIWAFVPSSDAQTVLAGATELTDMVQADTGLYIKPVVATDFSGVVEAICAGKAQMAALNTFSYILASSRGCAD